MSNTMPLPDPQEIEELAKLLAERFVVRWDWYGRQFKDRYQAFHEPLTTELLIDHLMGKITLGTYVLDAQNRGRYMVFDADDEPNMRRLIAMSEVLAQMGCPTYREASRRGGHLWFFFGEPLSGRNIRVFGQGVLNVFNIGEIELFPKQDSLKSGPGSMIRLPFGVHRRSGRRYGFYRPDGEPLADTLRKQIRLLAIPAAVPPRIIEFYAAHAERPVEPLPVDPNFEHAPVENGDFSSDLDRLKHEIRLRDYVRPYVQVNRRGMGLCPFHHDTVPSFHLNDDVNAWYCFAGCGGGSIIDFYIVLQQRLYGRSLDFRTALHELREELL